MTYQAATPQYRYTAASQDAFADSNTKWEPVPAFVSDPVLMFTQLASHALEALPETKRLNFVFGVTAYSSLCVKGL